MELSESKSLLAAVCLLVLTACEAPLDMQGVEQAQKEAVRRTDTFQDVVTLADATAAVFVGGDGIVVEFLSDGEVLRTQLGSFGAYPSLIDVTRCSDDTDYGLACSIWTGSSSRAVRVARQIEAGLIWINSWFLRDLRTPFGGMKKSGIGREGGVHGLEFYTELKNVCLKV